MITEKLLGGGEQSPPMSPKTRIELIKTHKHIVKDFIVPDYVEAELDPVELETHTILKQVTPQQRYWFYIERGFPENSVHEIDDESKERIKKLIPSRLVDNAKLALTVTQIENEIKYNHVTAIKQGVVDYILIDPQERLRLEIPPVFDRYEIVTARAPVPWHNDLISVRKEIEENLYITNSAMISLLDIYTKFEGLRIVDTSVFTSSILPISTNEFQAILKNQCAAFKNRVLSEWIPTVANMFLSTKDSWYCIASDCEDVDLGFRRLGKRDSPINLILIALLIPALNRLFFQICRCIDVQSAMVAGQRESQRF